jgi:hypothetical protein
MRRLLFTLALACSFFSPTHALVTFVQVNATNSGPGGTTSRNTTLPSPVTAGNLVVVVFAARDATATFTMADSAGDQFVLDGLFSGTVNSTSVQYGVFSCLRSVGGSSFSTTLTSTVSTVLFTANYEFSGVSLPNVWTLDHIATAAGTSATPNSGPITTAIANDALIGMDLDSQTPTTDAGWTAGSAVDDCSTASTELETESKLVTSTGSYSAPFTSGAGDQWVALIVAYGGALPPPPGHMVIQ